MSALKNNLLCLTLGLCLIFSGLFPGQAKAATDEELLANIIELTKILEELKLRLAAQAASTYVPPQTTNVVDHFLYPVSYEQTNLSVKLLQDVLATDVEIYPEANVTGYFGDLTVAALQKFQTKFALPVTGEFTSDTERILNATLSTIPLSNYPSTYLKNYAVISLIGDAVSDLSLKDTVVERKVVFSEKPVFSATVKSSDTATLQRILKTDASLLRNLKVTGLVDTMTMNALTNFRKNYGIPYVLPVNGVPVINELLSAKTLGLFNKILIVNNGPVIKSGLLLMTEVSPTTLIPNSTRKVAQVAAVRDYRANVTNVTVYYEGGISEKFTTSTVSPKTSVARAIAVKLSRPMTDITPVIKYESINGKDFSKILLDVYLSNSMVVNVSYKDGSSETIYVSENDIQAFVGHAYAGNYAAYQADFNLYVEKARVGEDIDIVYDLIAGALGRTKTEVKEILTINVEYYSGEPPCLAGCGA